MRGLHQRVGVAGLDWVFCKPWRHISNALPYAALHADAKPGGVQTVADGAFLQLLSQSFMPTPSPEFSPPARPVLANQHAASELLARALSQTTGSQPLYDLSTFLETSVPTGGVRPRNPGYDWRTWARSRLLAPYEQAPKPHTHSRDHEEHLALLAQLDAHMQLAVSRETIAKIAKLEMAHMWHRQQHDLRSGGRGPSAWQGASGRKDGADAATGSGTASDLWTPELSAERHQQDSHRTETAVATSPTPSSAVAGAAAVGDAAGRASASDPDDIFAAADRRARARAQQEQQQEHERRLAQAAAARDPVSALPAHVQLRLRELQRRAEAYGHAKGGPLAGVVRNVGEAFGQRVSYTRPAQGSTDTSGHPAMPLHVLRDGPGGALPMELTPQVNAADRQLGPQGTPGASPSLSYWADHPLLFYEDSVVALAVRRNAVRRLESADGTDGRASLATAVASLSLTRQLQSPAPRGSAPVLTLLLDYLKLKYLDVLHSWEVAARLQEATGRAEREAARRRTTMAVQVGPLLPAAVRQQLSGAWTQVAASFRPEVHLGALVRSDDGADSNTGANSAAVRQAGQRVLAVPLDWNRAEAMLEQEACRASASGYAGVGAGAPTSAAALPPDELVAVVHQALAPVHAAAMKRHQLMFSAHDWGVDGSARASAAAAADTGAGALKPSPTAAGHAPKTAADVVCFRETLVLDASSAFEDSSHDFRVTLEFDVDRLAAHEPALGGRWGVRFLERLLSLPEPSRRRRSALGGSMAGRARRGTAGRAALLGAVYPVDVERRFCPRTRTASLTTARYHSREANRKLLLENYSALLRTATQAAAGAGGAPPQ